jgi:hypothetical protein
MLFGSRNLHAVNTHPTHEILHVSGVTRPSSGGSAQMLFGSHNLHPVNTHPMHVIIANIICAEPPEDGRVTPETC